MRSRSDRARKFYSEVQHFGFQAVTKKYDFEKCMEFTNAYFQRKFGIFKSVAYVGLSGKAKRRREMRSKNVAPPSVYYPCCILSS